MKKVHLSGIAGTGMSALAGLFKRRGWIVSGSDQNVYPPVDRLLADLHVAVRPGYAAAHVPPDVDLCVLGNVLSRGNPEAEHVLAAGYDYLSMPEALYRHFIRGRQSVVVAGCHGKTTITSFVAFLLHHAGLRPGFFVGGKPADFTANFRLARGDYFVSEGDEYETAFFDRTSKFLKYRPKQLLLTAMEHDHLDFFPTPERYLQSFMQLVDQVPGNGVIVSNLDYEMNRLALARACAPVLTYGGPGADFEIGGLREEPGGYAFTLRHRSREWPFRTRLDGRYNAWNLAAGIALGHHLGLPLDLMQRAVAAFRGVERRLGVLRKSGETVFLEDFAHHPTAIASVLSSLRARHPGARLVAVFEPRSATLRRNVFQARLTDALAAADEVALMDVWLKERISPEERLDTAELVEELNRRGRRAVLCPDYGAVRGFLKGLRLDGPQRVVLFSNGGFGGIPAWVRDGLKEKPD